MTYQPETPLALIVATAKNKVIGFQNAMPWYLPEELKHFKLTTLGKPLIMGRNTFESIGRPLPGRTNIVVSRNSAFTHPGIKLANSLEEAIKIADAQAILDGATEIMIIGGEQIYRQALPLAKLIYLTLVDASPQGDAWFPELNLAEWQTTTLASFPAQEGNRYAYTLNRLQRI